MNLIDYIKGNKRGKEANQLERQAMNDAFLQEALDGYDSVTSDHGKALERLQTKILQPKSNKKNLIIYLSIAASILIIITVGSLYMRYDQLNRKKLIVKNMNNITKPIKDKQALVNKDEATLKPKRSAVQFCPPVIVACDAVVAPEEEVIMNNCVAGSYTISDSVPGIPKETLTVMANKEPDSMDEVVVGYGTSKKAEINRAITQKSLAIPFDEEQFMKYVQNNAKKQLCGGAKDTVTVNFVINKSSRPDKIVFVKASCLKAQNEISRLLGNSPDWAIIEKRINITIIW